MIMNYYLNACEKPSSMGLSNDFSLEDMVEDTSIRDVIRATVYDFNRTAGKLKKNRKNIHYLQHLIQVR